MEAMKSTLAEVKAEVFFSNEVFCKRSTSWIPYELCKQNETEQI